MNSALNVRSSSEMHVSTTEPRHPLNLLLVTDLPSVYPFSERSPSDSQESAIAVVASVGSVGLAEKLVQQHPPSAGLPVVTRSLS